MAGQHSSLDRFTLQVTPKINPGLSFMMNMDLNSFAQELVDRLDEDDLVHFVLGIVELYDDLDTTEHLLQKMQGLLRAQEKAALEDEDAT
jgi:hypothetical protein